MGGVVEEDMDTFHACMEHGMQVERRIKQVGRLGMEDQGEQR